MDELEELEEHLAMGLRTVRRLRTDGEPALTNLPSELIATYRHESKVLRQLLTSPAWPLAVDPESICDMKSDAEKQERAEAVVDLLVQRPVSDASFLDFGCGEGHVSEVLIQQGAAISVGYDIAEFWRAPPNKDNQILTTDFNLVRKLGPYDVVLLYDVLDHVVNEDPLEVLSRIRDVVDESGDIMIRCHPWISSHGSHLFHSLNKAYPHLVFYDEELRQMDLDIPSAHKLLHPVTAYRKWFSDTGFRILNEYITFRPTPEFFRDQPIVSQRIMRHWICSQEIKCGEKFPDHLIGQEFVDYHLTLAD